MVDVIQIKHASVAVHGSEACSYLADLISQSEEVVSVEPLSNKVEDDENIDLYISNSDQGLVLSWNKAGEKPLKFHLDFVKIAKQVRSFPAPKQGAFNQALGKKTKTIIDATGGWGGDSLLMSLQGYDVVLIERIPIMATLLTDAFDRLSSYLADSPWVNENQFVVPKVICGNALPVLQQNHLNADCIYLDPMFPPKRKKSAATNKQMQLLQWLAGADDDASELAAYAAANYIRLVVKRPDYAEPLLLNPTVQFSSKLVHYDVYL